MRTPQVQHGDPKEPLVVKVFEHLCQSILDEQGDPLVAERRLWTAPETAAHYVFAVATDEDRRRVAPIVHRLRTEASEIINRRLDRSGMRSTLGQRVAEARLQFSLRPWRATDAQQYAELLDNQSLWDALPDEYPGTMTEPMARDLIEISNGWSDRHDVSAIEWHGQPIGQVRLQFDSSDFADAAEISYWLGAPYWGRGLGTGIVSLFTAESFRRHPSLNRIFAIVLDGNAGSTRVLEKAGYRYESFRYQNIFKSGARRSSHVFGLCRADYSAIEVATV